MSLCAVKRTSLFHYLVDSSIKKKILWLTESTDQFGVLLFVVGCVCLFVGVFCPETLKHLVGWKINPPEP